VESGELIVMFFNSPLSTLHQGALIASTQNPSPKTVPFFPLLGDDSSQNIAENCRESIYALPQKRMKRALIVGINDYPNAPLKGCVPDAQKMYSLLSKNGDGSPNYSCRLLTSDNQRVVSKALLEESLEQLLIPDTDSAIFYFSGHGSRNILGGVLITQEAL
jgi:hypothetical protein